MLIGRPAGRRVSSSACACKLGRPCRERGRRCDGVAASTGLAGGDRAARASSAPVSPAGCLAAARGRASARTSRARRLHDRRAVPARSGVREGAQSWAPAAVKTPCWTGRTYGDVQPAPGGRSARRAARGRRDGVATGTAGWAAIASRCWESGPLAARAAVIAAAPRGHVVQSANVVSGLRDIVGVGLAVVRRVSPRAWRRQPVWRRAGARADSLGVLLRLQPGGGLGGPRGDLALRASRSTEVRASIAGGLIFPCQQCRPRRAAVAQAVASSSASEASLIGRGEGAGRDAEARRTASAPRAELAACRRGRRCASLLAWRSSAR